MLRFSLFSIPVRIKPLFWAIAIALVVGRGSGFFEPAGLPFLAAWITVVFVSVLIHELGHALVARTYGAEVDITLHGMGGYTRWSTPTGITPWRRVAVAAAGSTVGFVAGGAVWAGFEFGLISTEPGVLAFGLDQFWQVNIVWGILNWLPIRMLDGGHIFEGILDALFGKVGILIAAVVFPVFTIAAGLWALANGLLIAALFAGYVLMLEVQMWTAGRTRRRTPPPSTTDDGFTLFGDPDSGPRRDSDPV